MASDPLVEIARELYDAPPSRFVAARNARARDLKKDDPDLARRVSQLRRPSVPAWIVGQLVRHRADRLAQVLRLGAELREAQADLDAAALSALTRDRRKLTAALAREGAGLAAEHEVSATPAALDEVSQTLQAAMADAAASDAVMSGRLLRSLEVVGFDPVDLTDAVAGPAPEGGSPAHAAAPEPEDDLAARRARREAERAVRAAEKAVHGAEGAATESERALGELRRLRDEVRERRERLTRRRDELRAELDRVEDELEEARTTADELDPRLAEAREARERADADLEAARRRLDEARRGEDASD